jgi:hypothetical protein
MFMDVMEERVKGKMEDGILFLEWRVTLLRWSNDVWFKARLIDLKLKKF